VGPSYGPVVLGRESLTAAMWASKLRIGLPVPTCLRAQWVDGEAANSADG
jgi:hypothetical protein